MGYLKNIKRKIYWHYLSNTIYDYTWRIPWLYHKVKCKLGKHFWAGVTNKKNYQFCIRCNKEEYGVDNG